MTRLKKVVIALRNNLFLKRQRSQTLIYWNHCLRDPNVIYGWFCPKSQISQNLWGGWVHKIGSFVLNKTVSRLVFDHICLLPEEVKSETLRSNRKYDWKALFREFSQFSFKAMPESLMIGFTGRWSGKMLDSVGANFLHTTAPQCIGSHTSGDRDDKPTCFLEQPIGILIKW